MTPADGKDIFGTRKKRFKVNLHNHTTRSDGVFSPEKLVGYYAEAGYGAIALTDHYKSAALPVSDRTDIAVIRGIEAHPVGPRDIRLHLLGLNVPEGFEDPSPSPYQECIDRIVATGALCFLAHPYWSGLRSDDILAIRGLSGLEVYNADTRYIGKALSATHWDDLLDAGWKIPAIAVDDTHRPSDMFRAWTVLFADDNSPETLAHSLATGAFYASMGPEFHRVEADIPNRKLSVTCDPVEEAVLISRKNIGIKVTFPGIGDTEQDGRLVFAETTEISSFSVDIPKTIAYVRCQIRDRRGRYAWTNPIYFD